METPQVVVLILNYNSWKATDAYIHQLKLQQGIQLSVLVVDNCSTDGSYKSLCQHFQSDKQVEIIQSDYNGGYAYGNNFGLKHLQKKLLEKTFIVISNNDISIENPELLQELVTSYNQCDDIAFISPLMHMDGKPVRNTAWKIPEFSYDIKTVLSCNVAKAGEAVYYDLPMQQKLMPVDCLTGSFFMGKLDTFAQLDFFDERTFLYEEERILGQKVKKAGLRNYLALKLNFFHEDSAVISKEMNHLSQIQHLLHSRLVFHKYYAETNIVLLAFLKTFYSLFLFAKKVQLKFRKSNGSVY
ncbi:glycosyltransferase [Draconibacterium halophilum]|uniref:Glycosyltransferase family 2 protein n=1 Tax=Draconibacterium halophilum TaxID=2706887 RepID=A0A6C0RDY2_9BACT|nr:glycosyltransferase family 2 protein [Draconibacterium halophilum]QIA08550.1 glycosyltransferase family 2 protein [Draconibacterium halophilum]